MRIIQRSVYLQKLINRRDNGMVKVITGVRRAGKSFLLFNLYYNYLLSTGVDEGHIIALDLDSDENRKYRDPDVLWEYLRSHITNETEMFYVFLDEVQFAISEEEMKSDEPIRLYGILNGLLHKRNVDVYVTVSNSKMLSIDVRTEFRGRGDEVRVLPLSFSEFMTAYEGSKYDGWEEYLTYGGLPFILSCKTEEQKAAYLKNLFEDTYVKDVVARYHLRENNCVASLVNSLASSVGSLTNPRKLADTLSDKDIRVSEHTIRDYLSFLEEAFLISRTSRYDIKGKRYIDSPFKFYFADVGLRNALLDFRQQEGVPPMENVIYNELLFRGFNVDVGVVSTRVRHSDGKQEQQQSEVDFVCNRGSQRFYIQSAFAIPDREKMEQEQYSLVHINDYFKKIIVTQKNVKPWYNEKGILIIGILEFLLDPNSLDI